MSMDIVFVPSPRLREKSIDVRKDELGPELASYMKKMHSKMVELRGIGLAGVQVGDPRRLLVVDIDGDPIYMVNPEVIDASDYTVTFEEGCLSVPGGRVTVERPEEITVRYLKPTGELVERLFEEIEAVAIQHEIDHLNGITILDKLSKLKRDIYLRKIKKLERKIKNRLKQNSQLYY